MRIDRLDLMNFGPFRGQTLDFSAGKHGLHLVLGPNEAGKSSAMRAVRQLLYGIPHRTTDSFRGENADLRIGASLRQGDDTLHVIRRKAVKRSLFRGPEDEDEVDSSTFATRFLGDTTTESFDRMFTLDHRTLSEGGQATLSTGGEFAQILFGASLDLPRLRAYQKRLESQMEELFVPRGKRKINLLLTELEAARHQVLASAIKGADWTDQMALLEELRGKAGQIDQQRADIDRQRKRLDRISRAIPDLAERRAILQELHELGDVPDLADDFADRRRRCEIALRDELIALTVAENDVKSISATLEELPARAMILGDADTINALRLELGKEQKSAQNRQAAIKERDEAMAVAREHLMDLGRGDEDPATARTTILNAGEKARLRSLASDRQAIQVELQAAARAMAAGGRAIDLLEAQMASLPRSLPSDDLVRTLSAIESRGDLGSVIEASRGEISRLDRDVRSLLGKLGEPDADPQALVLRPVPTAEVIAAFKSQIERCEVEVSRHVEEVARIEDVLAECQSRIDRRRGETDVPTEEELLASRLHRDMGWKLIKRAWRDAASNPAAEDAFRRQEDADNLGDAFENTLRRTDSVADRLRRDAAIVAQERQDRATLSAEQARLALAAARRDEAKRHRQEVHQEWATAWHGAGITPRSPHEMAAWAANHGKLVEKVRELAEKTDQVAAWKAIMAEDVRAVERELVLLGETVTSDGTLATARARGHEVATRLRDLARTRESLGKEQRTADRERQQAEDDFQDAGRRMGEWERAWAGAVRPLGFEADATIDQVSTMLDAVDRFAAAQRLIRKLTVVIDESDQTSTALRDHLRHLVPRHVPALADRDAAILVAGLERQLREAQDVEQHREQTARHLREKQEFARGIAARMAGLQQALRALCEEAGCRSVEELAEVQRRWQARQVAQARLIAVETRLRPLALGKPLDDFAAETAEMDADELPIRLESLEVAYQEQDAQRHQISTQIGQEQAKLQTLETTARLARGDGAAADCEHLMARLETEVDLYVHLRLAWAVLREAIEEFRKKHQAPVLQRAGALFAGLTLGSFRDLRVDLNEKDQPELMGVRPEGLPSVGIGGMSVGTVDQLFLALKLALLDHYLQTHPPMPLVLDDLLVQFDDERAAAALGALAELSGRTQILFFTHHEHLVDLARDRLSGEVLFVHHLGESE